MRFDFFNTPGTVKYTMDDVKTYLETYDRHETNIIPIGSIGHSGLFYSEHTYLSGLVIRICWFSKQHAAPENPIITTRIFELAKENHIYPRNVFILHQSPSPPSATGRGITKGPITKNVYLALEHKMSSPLKTDPLFYNFLAEEIYNLSLFEEYYEKRNER